MTEISSSATLCAHWEEVRLQERPPLPLVRHAQVVAWLQRLQERAPELFRVEEAGRSVEGRVIPHVTSARGPSHVLLWSQMHGDEPTATTALFELFEYLRRYREEPRVQGCSAPHPARGAHAQPGRRRALSATQRAGDRHQPRRADLQTPEGRTLKALRDRLQPSLGFNLHNQNWRTAVGAAASPRPSRCSRRPSTRRAATPRAPARQEGVRRHPRCPGAAAPGQVGRYNDAFEVRAFGDNIGRWGTPTVLIETGPWPSPEPRGRCCG